jgi:hypothetical protein
MLKKYGLTDEQITNVLERLALNSERPILKPLRLEGQMD